MRSGKVLGKVREKAKEVLAAPVLTHRTLLYHDNPDDRRQLCDCLHALGDRGRLLFVNWCARFSSEPRIKVGPQVCPSIGFGGRKDRVFYSVVEALNDLGAMSIQYGLDVRRVLPELERRARKAGRG